MSDVNNEVELSRIPPDGSERLKRTFEAYCIGTLEALRAHLELFIEDVKLVPSQAFPERFGGVFIDADNLLMDITKILDRPKPSDVNNTVTDEMIEAAKRAMSWEGSTVPVEDQASLMRDVLTQALLNKGNTTILL
jgi:hypothetical protein